MKYRVVIIILVLIGFSMYSKAQKQAVDYVNMFVGTSNSRAMLGPYAGVPYGMVQLGPDNQDAGWMGAYEYALSNVKGFAHIHAWMMNGLLVMPSVQDFTTFEGSASSPYRGAGAGYHSRIYKDTEKGEPGYYSCFLFDADCKAEMTATARCGFHKYTFANGYKDARIMLDLDYPTEYESTLKEGSFKWVSGTEIEGYADIVIGNNFDYKLHFVIRFNKPVSSLNGWNETDVQHNIKQISGKGDFGGFVTFDIEPNESLMMQLGLSLVDIEGARKNLNTELTPYGWDFDKVRLAAKAEWNDLLSKIQVKGTEENKEKFYTNFYRSFAKQRWNDVDGRYVDPFERIQTLPEGVDIYGGDAFWNSFWNYNPLLALVAPEILNNWVLTQLELYDKTGWTNNGPSGIEHTGVMEVCHEVALMVGAYQKGIRNYDVNKMYEAIRHTTIEQGLTLPGSGKTGMEYLNAYNKFGYVPIELGDASRTLDYAYTDYCTAQMAKAMKQKKDYDFFIKRSNNWKNQFNVETKWQTPKDSTGAWMKNYSPFSGKKWIEGNGWQYTWYVPHDVKSLVQLMGQDLFNLRLEEGFEKSAKHLFTAHAFDRHQEQTLEYYVNHGNEGNMQAAYLFNYSGKPWLTQKYSRAILDNYYGNSPYNGWQGDEDEGQMSGWFVMSSLGLFEMSGGVDADPEFDISSPLFDEVAIQLDKNYTKGGIFTIRTINNSKENVYIQSATLNGKPYNSAKLKYSDVIKGGELLFRMGQKPNTKWGID